uniref:SHSP domain-containing protein n=1 Tax=Acrobeloides nanus TaxID=290746 RepID=A0A914C049_9BILA
MAARKVSISNSRTSNDDTFDESHESYLTSITKGLRKMSFNRKESFKKGESFKRKNDEANKEVLEITHKGDLDDWESLKFQLPYAKDVISLYDSQYEWEVALDVSGFKPDDLQVSIIRGSLVVDGYHDSRRDDIGSLAREIRRIIRIPENVQKTTLRVYMHPTGLLAIKASKKVDQNY